MNYFVFFIKDSTELKAVNRRFEATKQIIKKQGIDVAEISLSGDSRLSKIFSAIYIGDWLAYLLAIKYDKDPNAVPLVEDLKQKLSKM